MNYLRIISQHWFALLLVALFCGGGAVGLSWLLPHYYSSDVSLLIVQKQQQYTDAYTSQKAAEKLGKNLISVVETFDFMNRVVATGYVSPDVLSSSTEVRKKQWKRMVTASMIPETGVLKIRAYGIDPETAENVALGVATVLTTNSRDYHGGGDSVEIRQIDGPVTSRRPVKPNLALNGGAAFVLGLAVLYFIFLVRAEAERARAEKTAVHYATDTPVVFPVEAPHYKVLDEYPQQPYVYGAELKDVNDDDGDSDDDEAGAVSMQDHLPEDRPEGKEGE